MIFKQLEKAVVDVLQIIRLLNYAPANNNVAVSGDVIAIGKAMENFRHENKA
jgi:hypothetical protein